MRLVDCKSWGGWISSLGLSLAIVLSCDWNPERYEAKKSFAPLAKAYAQADKAPRFCPDERPALAIAKTLANWPAQACPTFLDTDRKQNLRLWPVIASGISRSPPLT